MTKEVTIKSLLENVDESSKLYFIVPKKEDDSSSVVGVNEDNIKYADGNVFIDIRSMQD